MIILYILSSGWDLICLFHNGFGILIVFSHLGIVQSTCIDQICNEVECGKGNCSASINYPLGYRCECQKGWKRVRLDEDDTDKLKFLPCVIPNCKFQLSSTALSMNLFKNC